MAETMLSSDRVVNATLLNLADRARNYANVKLPEEVVREISRFLEIQALSGRIFPLVVKKFRDDTWLSEYAFVSKEGIHVECRIKKNSPGEEYQYLLCASFSEPTVARFRKFCDVRAIPLCNEMIKYVDLSRTLKMTLAAAASSEWWCDAADKMVNADSVYFATPHCEITNPKEKHPVGVYDKTENIVWLVDPAQAEYRRKYTFKP